MDFIHIFIMAISKNVVLWLGKLRDGLLLTGESKTRGVQTELERRTGLSQGELSAWLSEEEGESAKAANWTLERFESVASRVRPGVPLHQVLREIEELPDYIREPSAVWSREQAIMATWRELFADNSTLGERMIRNIMDANELGLVELMARVCRQIINDGPHDAAGPIAALLHSYPKELSTAVLTRRRRKMAREYEKIA